jgi:hypothetical protein
MCHVKESFEYYDVVNNANTLIVSKVTSNNAKF